MVFRVYLTFFVLCLLSQPIIRAQPDDTPSTPDLSGFPTLKGTLSHLLGHEMGFIRPEPGEPFRLDLANLTEVTTLEFDPERESYIPLPGPLTVETVRYYPNGAFENMRLVSDMKEGSRVVIDIVPKPGQGPNRVLVWVVIETDVVQGVALIECEAEGAFPKRSP